MTDLELIAELQAQLAAAQRENEAWRALAEWSQGIGNSLVTKRMTLSGNVSWFIVASDRSGEEPRVGGGMTPGSAAIALAVKLGVLK